MLLQKIIEISKLSGRLVVLVVHYSKINWKNKHVASDVFAKKKLFSKYGKYGDSNSNEREWR